MSLWTPPRRSSPDLPFVVKLRQRDTTSSLVSFPEKWARLGWSVWHANKHSFDLPLRQDLQGFPREIPAWLNCNLLENRVDEEELPLRYGIDPYGLPNVMTWPAQGDWNTPLLQFPLAACPEPGSRHAAPPGESVLPFRIPARQTLAVFSLTGGSGRTSLAAGMARLLAGTGLHVLLVDTSAFSLLPRLFGAGSCRQGVLRDFLPTAGDSNGMISLISLAVEPFAGDDYEQYRILQELRVHAARVDRVVWDLSGAPLEWASKVLGCCPQILVPLLPNMNSLMQLRATEKFLNQCHDDDPSPHLRYVLSHFNEDDMLHQDMRERFERQLGSKLLRVSMRCSSLVDEAMFCGRTVIDHAPESALVEDLWRLAQQLQQVDGSMEPPANTPSEWYEQ